MFVLMNKKTTAAYTHLFEHINNNIFKLEADSFITDFEVALKNGLKHISPNAKYQNCWFHYCQALRRNLSTKHKRLAETVRNNKEASMYFHKFMALALLPDYCIESTFIMLKQKIKASFPDEKFKSFLDYYEKHWIKKVLYFYFLYMYIFSHIYLFFRLVPVIFLSSKK